MERHIVKMVIKTLILWECNRWITVCESHTNGGTQTMSKKDNGSERVRRRRFLQYTTAAGLVGIAGCTSGGGGGGGGGDGGGGDGSDSTPTQTTGGSDSTSTEGGGDGGSQAPQSDLSYAGGTTGTAGYNLATSQAQMMREVTDQRFVVTVKSTGGTVANVRLIDSGDFDIGFVVGPNIINGALGEGAYDEAYPVTMLFTDTLIPGPFALTLEGNGIDYLEDLLDGNTRMAAGPPGSLPQDFTTQYFKLNDMWEGGVINWQKLEYSDGLRALNQGNVDASVGYGVNHTPPPWMAEWLNRRDDAKLVPPKNNERVQAFIDGYKGGTSWEMNLQEFGPAWNNSVLSDTETLLQNGLVEAHLTTPKLKEEHAYWFTKLALDNADKLPEYHNLWKGFASDPLAMATAYTVEEVPYHPGAVRAMEEHGLEEDLPVAGQ